MEKLIMYFFIGIAFVVLLLVYIAGGYLETWEKMKKEEEESLSPHQLEAKKKASENAGCILFGIAIVITIILVIMLA